ncbi:Cytochrome P450 [Corchorus capsularis]|uniref:Cytochrome P450 n=1 Tax=Corchorus capsularis TaxID=210143 RepID=A0A1R3JMA7_COCAP|nr:Cytochrome P450 [Corchorus capsularis]
METWFLILFTASVSLLLLHQAFLNLFFASRKQLILHRLPPGPPTFPIIGNILWLRNSVFQNLEQILRHLHKKLGPMVTIHTGTRPNIIINDRFLAQQALVQSGSLFADRPKPLPANKIMKTQHNISSSTYGPTWRLLRRNLTSEILHPSRVQSHSHARKWVLEILFDSLELQSKAKTGDPVHVLDHFRHAMFCLLSLMCFGDKLTQDEIKGIETVLRRLLTGFIGQFTILNFWPRITKILLRKKWEKLYQLRKEQEDVLVPFIRARKKAKEEKIDDYVLAYVDTLFDLELPDEKRKLDEGEIVSLASEFLNSGTDTTSTALQWIMANLVKYPNVQDKLFLEIKGVMGKTGEEEIKEEDLQKIPYLKAVILEGLRRHPPGHFLLPHRATDDTNLGGFLVPKDGTINFMVADIGRDPKVWEDPMEFKPERFLRNYNDDCSSMEVFDITGRREIKMMPFGAGRRICPALGLAVFHLEYFVANLVWKFEWKAMEGDEISLEEKQEFTTVMKTPLQAYISPRKR